jgi:hypothetical protein
MAAQEEELHATSQMFGAPSELETKQKVRQLGMLQGSDYCAHTIMANTTSHDGLYQTNMEVIAKCMHVYRYAMACMQYGPRGTMYQCACLQQHKHATMLVLQKYLSPHPCNKQRQMRCAWWLLHPPIFELGGKETGQVACIACSERSRQLFVNHLWSVPVCMPCYTA